MTAAAAPGARDERQAFKRAVLEQRRAQHPPAARAVAADARRAVGGREDRASRARRFVEVARLLWTDDAFLALALYRLRARWAARGVPVLPRLAHHLSMAIAGVCIGDPVVVAAGVVVPHGAVVIDGIVDVGPGVELGPWVTVGLRAGDPRGPSIGAGVRIGEGAKVIGPVRLGDGAIVEPNAVVVDDVPAGATVAGIPARTVRR